MSMRENAIGGLATAGIAVGALGATACTSGTTTTTATVAAKLGGQVGTS